MKPKSYYEEPIDGITTQCMQDLIDGKIHIQDVPFEHRGHLEYLYAHKFARTIENDAERHDQYWKIASQLEDDVLKSEREDDKDREKMLMYAYNNLFHFMTRFFP